MAQDLEALKVNNNIISIRCTKEKLEKNYRAQTIYCPNSLQIFLTAECRRAHSGHLVNTIELVLPSTYPSPQPKRQVGRLNRFCTAHGKKILIL